MEGESNPVGRPTDYTSEKANYICNKIAAGIPLAQICREDGMPDRTTVYDWMKANEEFSQHFARAREAGYDAIADDCIQIADDNSRDVVEMDMGDGVKVQTVDHDVIQRSKLRVETRLKLLAKWSPKKYGDKVEHSGNLNLTNNPITFE